MGSFFRLFDGVVESPLFNGTEIILGTAQPFDGAHPSASGENITAEGSFFLQSFLHFTDTAVAASRIAWNMAKR